MPSFSSASRSTSVRRRFDMPVCMRMHVPLSDSGAAHNRGAQDLKNPQPVIRRRVQG